MLDRDSASGLRHLAAGVPGRWGPRQRRAQVRQTGQRKGGQGWRPGRVTDRVMEHGTPFRGVWWLKTRIRDLGEKSKAPSQSVTFPWAIHTHTPSIRGRWVTCISRFADPLWGTVFYTLSLILYISSEGPLQPHSFLFPLRDRQIVGRVILFLLPFTYRFFLSLQDT